MIRNLKALGLALAAVLALGAMTASSASAQKFTTPTTATLKGTQTGVAPADNSLTLTGNSTICPDATYTVHKIAQTPHVAVPNGATEITVTPHYGTCETKTAVGGFHTTVDMNGCDYTFKIGATTGGVAGTYGVTAGVVCPAGKDIIITIGTGANPDTTIWCDVTIHYEPGKHYNGLHATSTGNNQIDIVGTINEFKSVSTNTQANHPNFLPCSGTHSIANGNAPLLHIDVSAVGTLNEPISISHP